MQTFKDYFLLSEKKQRNVFYIGKFLPPTMEDFLNLQYLSKRYDTINVYISNPHKKTRKISSTKCKQILDIYSNYINDAKIKIKISSFPSPFQTVLHDIEHKILEDVIIYVHHDSEGNWEKAKEDVKRLYNKEVKFIKLPKRSDINSTSDKFTSKENDKISKLIGN